MRLRQFSAATPPTPLTDFIPLSVNLSNDLNMWLGLGQPPVETRIFMTGTPSNRFAFVTSNLRNFYEYQNDYWNGADCDVFAAKNGRFELLRSTTVADSGVDLIDNFANNEMVTATSAKFRVLSSMLGGGQIWFRVAAINASSEIGPYTAWASVTLPNPAVQGATFTNTTSPVTISGEDSGLAAPANFTVALNGSDSGQVDLSWDAVSGASGYFPQLCYQDPSVNASPEFLDLGAGTAIPAGALVILRKRHLTMPDNLCVRIGNGADTRDFGLQPYRRSFTQADKAAGTVPTWIAYSGGDAAPTGVDAPYYVRCPAKTDFIRIPLHSGTAQTFYPNMVPGRTYRMRFLMRADAARTVTMTFDGVTAGGSDSYSVTTSWQWFETDASRDTLLESGSAQSLKLSVSAGHIDIADMQLFDTITDFRDLPPDALSRMPAGGFLRMHQTVRNFPHPDMAGLTSRQGFGGNKFVTLHSGLWGAQENGMLPWLQVEWARPGAEFIEMVDYLAAPTNARRALQGQAAPWVNEFASIIFEFGNEAWQVSNGAFFNLPAGMVDIATGATYSSAAAFGMMCQWQIDQMKTSANYAAFRAKTRFYLGGRITNDFGTEAAQYCPDADFTGPSAYNGGWESGQSASSETSESFLRLSDNNHTAPFVTRASEASSAGLEIGSYEWGPGYSAPGTLEGEPRVAEEVVMKSRIAGTMTLDSIALQGLAGFTANAFFLVGPGDYWKSHSSPSQGDATFMPYGLVKIVHDAVGPCTVTQLTTVQNPDRILGATGVPALRAYMFTSAATPSTRVIAAINRNIDPSLLETDDPLYSATPGGTEAMTINTGLASCTGLEYYANVGNFRQHNRYSPGERMNAAGDGVVADALCVAFSYNLTTGSALADASQIVIDDTYGASASGLPAGNCVLLKLTGCVAS